MSRATALLAAALLAVAPALAPALVGAAQLTLACGRPGPEHQLCREAAGDWADASGHAVRVVSIPEDAAEHLRLLRDLLAAGAHELDALDLRAEWAGELAPYLAALPAMPGADADVFAAALAQVEIDGRLVALPWSVDAGVLYARRDLLARYRLAPPPTWSQLADHAARLQEAERLLGNSGFWGHVWAGQPDAALGWLALEWSAGQGDALADASGRPRLDTPALRYSLERARDWLGDISPPTLLMEDEAAVRQRFLAGGAAFLRGWTSERVELMADDGPLAGRVALMPLPRGETGKVSRAMVRSVALAVSAASRHPDAAADLIGFLTSPEVQVRRARILGAAPARVALYGDPELLADAPWLEGLAPVLEGFTAPPSAGLGRGDGTLLRDLGRTARGVLNGALETASALEALDGRWRGAAP